MSDVTLGKLLTGNEQRDAVHVAIAPVVAGVDLEPGQHVGLFADGTASPTKPRIGIVDPFLTARLSRGERFYLFLYPNTVTSLRHEWTHPAFPVASTCTSDEKAESEKWLRAYAIRCNRYDEIEDKAFDRLIEGLKSRELFFYGSDLHGLYDLDNADELRFHAERYLGIRINWDNFSFSCSC